MQLNPISLFFSFLFSSFFILLPHMTRFDQKIFMDVFSQQPGGDKVFSSTLRLDGSKVSTSKQAPSVIFFAYLMQSRTRQFMGTLEPSQSFGSAQKQNIFPRKKNANFIILEEQRRVDGEILGI